MSIHYPIYRKSLSGKSYYRIASAQQMVELQQIGSRWIIHEIEAKILPERVLIDDLIACRDGLYIEISAEDFNIAQSNSQ
jgi:hypothetical protein